MEMLGCLIKNTRIAILFDNAFNDNPNFGYHTKDYIDASQKETHSFLADYLTAVVFSDVKCSTKLCNSF